MDIQEDTLVPIVVDLGVAKKQELDESFQFHQNLHSKEFDLNLNLYWMPFILTFIKIQQPVLHLQFGRMHD